MAGDETRKTRNKRRESSSSRFPTQLVCTAHHATSSKNSMELGLVFGLCVVGLYLYGFLESLHALPPITGLEKNFAGRNLNLAHMDDNLEYAAEGIQPQANNAPTVQDSEDSSGSGDSSPEEDADNSNPLVLASSISIPKGIWPVTLQNDKFETILHTGDLTTKMSVPPFWSIPVHNKEFFTREQAMEIGTCITPDSSGNNVRGDACPMHERTIFIAIASYRDFQCRFTVESAFKRAKHPERIRVGTCVENAV
jgi:hypothetical protein